jgi:molecular chaperone HscA
VASVRHGVAECLPDAQGHVILPSVVRYLRVAGARSGWTPRPALAQDPENTIASVKRFMGRSLADVAGHDKLPYRFVDHAGMLGLQTVAG